MDPITTRRRFNPQQRRNDLCDAATDVLGTAGSRGLTHLEVDRRAGMPAGTTSAYYRTRDALLHGIAARITELDLNDLAHSSEATGPGVELKPDITQLARIVMTSVREPGLTRTRARFELALQASRDPVLKSILQQTNSFFTSIARRAVEAWQEQTQSTDVSLEDKTFVVLSFLDGVMMGFVREVDTIKDEQHLSQMLREIIQVGE